MDEDICLDDLACFRLWPLSSGTLEPDLWPSLINYWSTVLRDVSEHTSQTRGEMTFCELTLFSFFKEQRYFRVF
jgi:hypothetical protein